MRDVTEIKSREERLAALLALPDLMDEIVAHVTNGSFLTYFSEIYNVPYPPLVEWVMSDATRKKRFDDAVKFRQEFFLRELVSEQLKAIATSDLRKVLDENGCVRPVKDWPASVAQAIASIEVDEIWEGRGDDRRQIGVTKKIKFWDKNKALDTIGRMIGLIVDKQIHDIGETLEDLIVASRQPRRVEEKK